MSKSRPHILVIGGGYVGLYTAYGLQRRIRPGQAQVTLVSPESYMTYQPFLPEAAAGSLEPRHVVAPLRQMLQRVRIINAELVSLDHGARTARICAVSGEEREIGYDVVALALGSVARTLPIPGLAEQGIGFRNVGEAIYLRNHVLSRLDVAVSTDDPERRRRALNFVFIGGGYAGVEAMAELEDMARDACRYYKGLDAAELRWVLVDAADRIMPEVDLDLANYTVDRLEDRGIEVRTSTRLNTCVDGHVELSDGTAFDTDTVVWTAGVKPHPVLAATDLPRDEKGRLRCNADLTVEGVEDAWAAGDCAGVPDLTRPGEVCAPTAQHAVRQARLLARNVYATIRGGKPAEYRHRNVGSVATLGLHKGVAQVYGVKVRGWPAWFMHRTYHVSRMPSLNRKVRVVGDWTFSLFFKRENVSLGQLHRPRQEFELASRTGAAPEPRRAPASARG
ncbi:MAG: NAD(P)/FAD-dependent oxidoreductase [Streptosporangiales bacterium]|nr:NAD(P)/FAD-dependent oxidoreductase [Streptosporangiales bacterium]MBO0890435.1 NAD(P)/FAD-dependent oxidoreductase [Acidothermales bacterium]